MRSGKRGGADIPLHPRAKAKWELEKEETKNLTKRDPRNPKGTQFAWDLQSRYFSDRFPGSYKMHEFGAGQMVFDRDTARVGKVMSANVLYYNVKWTRSEPAEEIDQHNPRYIHAE